MKTLHIKLYQAPKEAGAEFWADLPQGSDFDTPAGWTPLRLGQVLPELVENSLNALVQYAHVADQHLLPTAWALHEFLFGPEGAPNALDDHLRTCRTQASQQGHSLRTLLHLDPKSSLLPLPWEMSRNRANNNAADLAAMNQLHNPTLVRVAWGTSQSPLPPVPRGPSDPLRLLLVESFTEDESTVLGGLDEILEVDDAIFKLAPWGIDLRVLRNPSEALLRDWCQKWQPHIFHFIGHGAVLGDGRAVLQLVTGAVYPEPLDAWSLSNMFNNVTPRLVILNACRSGLQEADAREAVAARSFSQTLINRGVLGVIAMQANINGKAAARLMGEFYRNITEGAPVDHALTAARISLVGKTLARWDWAMPTLYLAAGADVDDLLPVAKMTERVSVFPDTDTPWREPVTSLPWPVAIQIKVGYDNELRNLEEWFLKTTQDMSTPITVITGRKGSGKTTLLYWLLERSMQAERACLLVDFARSQALEYWGLLRHIRNSDLAFRGGRLLSRDDWVRERDVLFNRFNHQLNLLVVPDPPPGGAAVADQPLEDNTAVEDRTPLGYYNLADEAAKKGNLPNDQSLLKLLTELFWKGLQRVAEPNGLTLFLDHPDYALHYPRLDKATLDQFKSTLLPLATTESKIRIVITLKEASLNAAWNSLRSNPLARNVTILSLDGLDARNLAWLVRMWANRYFVRSSASVHLDDESPLNQASSEFLQRQLKHEVTTSKLKERLDTYITAKLLDYKGMDVVLPGTVISNLLAREVLQNQVLRHQP